MERRLRGEEVVTIGVLHERGMSNRAVARQLGVHEHAVRYRLRRLTSGAPDGRTAKPFAAESVRVTIGVLAEKGTNHCAIAISSARRRHAIGPTPWGLRLSGGS